MDYQAERRSIENYVQDKSVDELRAYLEENNAASIDGLPGLGDPNQVDKSYYK